MATFAALVVFSSVCVVLGLVSLIGVITYLSSERSVRKPLEKDKYVLRIDLGDYISERDYPPTDYDLLGSVFTNRTAKSFGFETFKRALTAAAKDPKIQAVCLQPAVGCPNSYAMQARMAEQIRSFQKTGKKVYAYGDYDEKSYFLCSLADSIFIAPEGYFEWDGFAAKLLFFKRAIDALGLDVQIFYAGKFKSATEPFRREKMSPENREQISAWMRDFYGQFLNEISANRHVPASLLRTYAERLLLGSPADLLNTRMVDFVGYQDEVDNKIKAQLGYAADENLRYIRLREYVESLSPPTTTPREKNVAVLYLDGDIVDERPDGNHYIVGDDFAKEIHKLAQDKSIGAVVLRINSPGGSVNASEKIWREIKNLSQIKPVVASMGAVAASGGYYLAAPAHHIIAEPWTITGSIGVFYVLPSLDRFYENKLGVTTDMVKTSENATIMANGSLLAVDKLNETQKKFVQQIIDRIYVNFKQKVAEGRHLTIEEVEKIAQGRVWTGKQALANGLVDSVAGLQAAIEKAARLGDLSEYGVKYFPKVKSILGRFFEQQFDVDKLAYFFSASYPLPFDERFTYKHLSKKYGFGQVMARLPYECEW